MYNAYRVIIYNRRSLLDGCKCIEKLLLYSLGKQFNRRPRNCGVTPYVERTSQDHVPETGNPRRATIGESGPPLLPVPPPQPLPNPSSLLDGVYVPPLHACSSLMRCKFMCGRNNVQRRRFSSSSVTWPDRSAFLSPQFTRAGSRAPRREAR